MFTAVVQSGEIFWPVIEQHLISSVLPKMYYSWTVALSLTSTWLGSASFHASIPTGLTKKTLSIKKKVNLSTYGMMKRKLSK